MTITVRRGALTGCAAVPASKSALHRLLICAALSDGSTELKNAALSQDIVATMDCLRALGATIEERPYRLTVTPGVREGSPLLDCGESGSTLRFLLPVAAALGVDARFTGRGRLAQRPLSPLYELLAGSGCTLTPAGQFPLQIGGRLQGGVWELDGGVSSQFISGLLLAAPLLNEDCTIRVAGVLESRPYVRLTVDAMRRFGVTVEQEEAVFRITASSRYRSPGTATAEGDWSNGAFWLVAAALIPGNDLLVAGLENTSHQGDRRIVELLREAGASVTWTGDGKARVAGVVSRPFTVDVADIPDLVPVLAVLAAAAPGRSVIANARRLRLKESDRLCSVCELLTALGGTVTMTEDTLVIDGTGSLRGGTVNACNDHRIAMAAAVAACLCRDPVIITGAEAVRKSYPGFFREFSERGMDVWPPYSGES